MTLIASRRNILNDVDPQPMRQIKGPLKIRLGRLHEVAQAATGRTDTHLYGFRSGGAGWGVPDPDGFFDGPMPAQKTTLQKIIEDTGARTIHLPRHPDPYRSYRKIAGRTGTLESFVHVGEVV